MYQCPDPQCTQVEDIMYANEWLCTCQYSLKHKRGGLFFFWVIMIRSVKKVGKCYKVLFLGRTNCVNIYVIIPCAFYWCNCDSICCMYQMITSTSSVHELQVFLIKYFNFKFLSFLQTHSSSILSQEETRSLLELALLQNNESTKYQAKTLSATFSHSPAIINALNTELPSLLAPPTCDIDIVV